MRRPGRSTFEADPALWHYTRRLDATRLARQYDLFTHHIEHAGAEIEWIPAVDDGLADSIFVFDPSFMTPHGAIVLRPSKALRVPEVIAARRALRRARRPRDRHHHGDREPRRGATWSGWTRPRWWRGGGSGPTRRGSTSSRESWGPLGVAIHVFDLPVWRGSAACLHLLSLMSPLDRDLALVYKPLMPVALYQMLRERGIECVEASEKEFVKSGGPERQRAGAGAAQVPDPGGVSRDAAHHEECRVRGDLLHGGCAVLAVRGRADVSDPADLAGLNPISSGSVVPFIDNAGLRPPNVHRNAELPRPWNGNSSCR